MRACVCWCLGCCVVDKRGGFHSSVRPISNANDSAPRSIDIPIYPPTGWGPAEWEAALSHKVRVQRPLAASPPRPHGGETKTEGEGQQEQAEEGEEEVPAVLAQWLPLGYDLYVIGVQESACLREMRRAVHAYLGGWVSWVGEGGRVRVGGRWIACQVSGTTGGKKEGRPLSHMPVHTPMTMPGGPGAYACFGREIGDARVLHGLIAVTLFVRASHVQEGAFQVRREGKRGEGRLCMYGWMDGWMGGWVDGCVSAYLSAPLSVLLCLCLSVCLSVYLSASSLLWCVRPPLHMQTHYVHIDGYLSTYIRCSPIYQPIPPPLACTHPHHQVQQGAVNRVATGVNLGPMGRAANKGGWVM